MNSIIEKEKKLNQTLEKLKNLDLAKKDNSPELENLKGKTSLKFRELMSSKAFGLTAYYDDMIANWFNKKLKISIWKNFSANISTIKDTARKFRFIFNNKFFFNLF